MKSISKWIFSLCKRDTKEKIKVYGDELVLGWYDGSRFVPEQGGICIVHNKHGLFLAVYNEKTGEFEERRTHLVIRDVGRWCWIEYLLCLPGFVEIFRKDIFLKGNGYSLNENSSRMHSMALEMWITGQFFNLATWNGSTWKVNFENIEDLEKGLNSCVSSKEHPDALCLNYRYPKEDK